MEYTVLEHEDLKKFIELVNAAIIEGWRPQGGVSYMKGWSPRYTQAMIRDRSVLKS
jgi:hypothetical protein